MMTETKEQRLDKELKALAKEVTPDRDLWSGIELAIEHKAQKKKTSTLPVAWAASIVAAVLLSWMAFDPVEQVEDGYSLAKQMDNRFQQDKQAMLISLGQPNMSELPEEMQLQFTQLSSARKSLEKALSDDPENNELINLLGWLHQQELQLLEQIYRPQWQTI